MGADRVYAWTQPELGLGGWPGLGSMWGGSCWAPATRRSAADVGADAPKGILARQTDMLGGGWVRRESLEMNKDKSLVRRSLFSVYRDLSHSYAGKEKVKEQTMRSANKGKSAVRAGLLAAILIWSMLICVLFSAGGNRRLGLRRTLGAAYFGHSLSCACFCCFSVKQGPFLTQGTTFCQAHISVHYLRRVLLRRTYESPVFPNPLTGCLCS